MSDGMIGELDSQPAFRFGEKVQSRKTIRNDGTYVGKDIAYRGNMYNPMYFLAQSYDGYKSSTVAPHWRIRTGIMQGDTANTVEINLALALQALGSDVDFATVWGQGHTMAERTGDATTNFITWVGDAAKKL